MRRRDFIISTCLAIAAPSAALAGQLPQTFVNLYRPAVDRLQQAYSRLTIAGTLSVELPAEEKSSEQGFILRADGKNRRIDVRTYAQQGMGLQVGATEMQMATPQGSLNTYTRPKSKFFDDAQQRDYSGVVDDIDRKCMITYPYALDSQSTILDMLRSPTVKVSSVRWIRAEGEAMVQVDYRETAQHAGRSGTWTSSLVLAPDDAWALRSFNRTLDGSSPALSQRGELSYSLGADGIPLLQSIQVETSQGNKALRREGVSVSNLDFSEPDPALFGSFTF